MRPSQFCCDPRPRRGRTFLATRDPCDPATLPTLCAASTIRPGRGWLDGNGVTGDDIIAAGVTGGDIKDDGVTGGGVSDAGPMGTWIFLSDRVRRDQSRRLFLRAQHSLSSVCAAYDSDISRRCIKFSVSGTVIGPCTRSKSSSMVQSL